MEAKQSQFIFVDSYRVDRDGRGRRAEVNDPLQNCFGPSSVPRIWERNPAEG